MNRINNLNSLKRHYTDIDDMEPYERKLHDFSKENIESKNQETSVYFKNIEETIVEKIKQADVVVGCVAWMTSEPIIKSLSEKIGSSVILQKEDFLRPDTNQQTANKRKLRSLYESISPILLYEFDSEIQVRGKSVFFDKDGGKNLFGFRCIGHIKKHNEYAMPRMHHKFLVFCHYVEEIDYGDPNASHYQPYAVWTGSFNMTKNATNSLENGIYISSSSVAQQYYNEWKQLIMVSEPLNWELEYAAPELEINTLACIS